jgi:hypothetical protein
LIRQRTILYEVNDTGFSGSASICLTSDNPYFLTTAFTSPRTAPASVQLDTLRNSRLHTISLLFTDTWRYLERAIPTTTSCLVSCGKQAFSMVWRRMIPHSIKAALYLHGRNGRWILTSYTRYPVRYTTGSNAFTSFLVMICLGYICLISCSTYPSCVPMNLAFFPTLSTSSLLSPTNVKNLEASSIFGHCAFQCCRAIGARVLLPFLVPMVDLYRLIDLRLFEIRYFPNTKSAPAAITVHTYL